MQQQFFTLPNGLQIILIDTKSFPTITTLLLVGAGSRYEDKKNNGIAHFFEHMAFKGSSKYANSFVISSTIEGLGGAFNAFTSKDHTGYWIKATASHFPTVVDVLSDMVLHPLLLEEEINREKGVIVEEINMYEDMPSRKVSEIFETLLYKGNPLGYDIAGSKKTVMSFTQKTFKDYIGELYHPANAVLVVAGGLEQGVNYRKLIEESFGTWDGDNRKTVFEPVSEQQTEPQILVQKKKTEQAHFCLGFRAFPLMDERRYAMSVLTAILGGGMSSRLFIEVRERRGLCYYISTGRELYTDVGNVVTQAGVTNKLDKVKEAVKVILQEHKKIGTDTITAEELSKAKELIKGRLLLSMEDSLNIASFYGSKQLLEQQVLDPAEVIKKLDSVTGEEVSAIAREVFIPGRLNFTMIGPFEKDAITKEDLSM
ncbi:insulinase family protein [Candidatus Roizmanbacteria bacterium]|nr:insulinase family protein [Candidatus Roizmanbacteria bacterium]